MEIMGDLSASRYKRLEQPVPTSTETPRSDQVLDLSGPQLKEEILQQDLSKVSAIKVGDQYFQLSPQDLRQLVKDLKQEVLSRGNLRPDFQSLKFYNGTGIVLERKPELGSRDAQRSTYFRGIERDRIQTVGDARRALQTDLELTRPKGKYSHAQGSGYGTIAAKMLVQDLVVLERMGLLEPGDKKTLDEITDRLSKAKGKAIPQADIDALYQMAQKYAADGALPETAPERSNDQKTLDMADAAGNDLQLAMKEDGMDKGIMAGRSIERIDRATRAVSRLHDKLEYELIPAAERDLDTALKAYNECLMRLTGTSNPSDALRVYDADPGKYEANPHFKPLKEAKDQALGRYQALTGKRQELAELKVKGLTMVGELLQIRQIDETARGERTAAMGDMTRRMADGTQRLNQLEWRIQAAQNSTWIGEDTEGPDPSADELARAQDVQEQKQAHINSLADEAIGVRDEMIAGMEDMIAKIENSVKNQQTLSGPQRAQLEKLVGTLRAQLNTLRGLGIDRSPEAEAANRVSYGTLEDFVKSMEGIRSGMIAELRKLPAAFIDQREVDALAGLDDRVSEFSDADTRTAASAQAARDQISLELSQTRTKLETLKLKEEAKANEGMGGVDVDSFLATAAGGSEVDLYVGAGVRVGTRSNNVHLEATLHLKAEKRDVGYGDRYILKASIEGEIGYDLDAWLFESHGGVSLDYTLAGVAFGRPDQVEHAAMLLDRVIKRLTDLDPSGADEAWDAFTDYLSKFKIGSDTTWKAGAEKMIGSESGWGGGIAVTGSTGTAEFAATDPDGHLRVPPETDYVTTEKISGSGKLVTPGEHEYEVEVSREVSTVSASENGAPRMIPGANGEMVPNRKEEISVELKIPGSMLIKLGRDFMNNGGKVILPAGMAAELVKILKNGSKELATMDDAAIQASLLTMLAEAFKNPVLMAKIGQVGDYFDKIKAAEEALGDKAPVALDSGFSATIGLKYAPLEPGGPPGFKVEVGFEAHLEIEAAAGTGVQVYGKAGVNLKYAQEVWKQKQ